MKTYVFTLTDEAQATPDKFVPTIQNIISTKGGFDFQHLVAIGCITANFASEQTFEPIDGVLAIEENIICTTQN